MVSPMKTPIGAADERGDIGNLAAVHEHARSEQHDVLWNREVPAPATTKSTYNHQQRSMLAEQDLEDVRHWGSRSRS